MEYQKWNKDPLKNVCDSYLNARKEVGILLSLQHDHIVFLLGLCLDPLALVLHLAPQGSLSDRLKEYLRAGDRLSTPVIRDVIVQVNYHCLMLCDRLSTPVIRDIIIQVNYHCLMMCDRLSDMLSTPVIRDIIVQVNYH